MPAAENPLERIPPHDEAAERGVLGAMLCDSRAVEVALEVLKDQDFYLPKHQLLFQVFADVSKKQEVLDQISVGSELGRRGLWERVGGKDVLGELIEATPTAVNIERHCEIVQERATERALLGAAGQIIRMCQQPGPGEDSATLLDRSEALLFEIAKRRGEKQAVSIMSVLDQVLAEAERHIQARATGQQIPSAAIPTGFADMDDMFSGGLWPSEVAVIAARPGVGKTTLALNIARRAACRPREKGPIPVAVFNMEMPKEQLAKNILCAEAQINSRRLRNYALDDEEYQKVKLASHNLGNAPIFIDDSPGLTPFELRARGRRLYRAQGVRLIIVDYLQLMQPAGRHDNREQAVADLSRQVKHLARELGIPILLLSQLRRPPPGEEGQRPKLGDLRESGAIEQDADLVVMLHRPLDRETAVMKEEVFAIVQKNRNGPIGQFQLTFFPHQLRFEDFIKEPVDAHSAVGV